MKFGFGSYVFVGCPLMDMYSKSGLVYDAKRVFDEKPERNAVMYNTMITWLLRYGMVVDSREMRIEGLAMDQFTFGSMLTAYGALMLAVGQYFESMVKEHGIMLVVDHYTRMIDLLRRAGRFEEERCFINKMPFPPDPIGWSTLLSSCRLHGNLEIEKWAAASLQELEPHYPTGYILLSSIYVAKGKWDNVAELRMGMKNKRARKEPGSSWIKCKGKVHIFSADDRTSPFSDKIYAELDELNHKMIEDGYVPDMSSVLHDVGESEKIKMLDYHREVYNCIWVDIYSS
ncbi:hypothetical protein CRYUN_Cryun04dG0190600 [Craigia yunnanensis]